MERETRFLPVDDLEVRFLEGGRVQINGYAAKFNAPSRLMHHPQYGEIREIIRPGAFTDTISKRNKFPEDVVANIDHDNDRILARTSGGTLRLSEDALGLRIEADLADTTRAKDLIADIKHRNYQGMSFAFTCQRELVREEKEQGWVRELHEATLFDVAVVVDPAYTQTSVGVAARSIEREVERRAAVAVEEKAEETKATEADQAAKDAAELKMKALQLKQKLYELDA